MARDGLFVRIYCTILLAFFGLRLEAQTPTVIQWASSSNTRNEAALNNNGTFHLKLPNPSQAHNTLIGVFYATASSTFKISWSDDMGNTWTGAFTNDDATHNVHQIFAYASNCAAGTREIFPKNVTGEAVAFAAGWVAEVNNLALDSPVDVFAGSTGTSATIQSGGITPSQAGDFLLFYTCYTDGFSGTKPNSYLYTAGSQAEITWTLLHANNESTESASASQWGQYNSTSAINPQMTATSSQPFLAGTVAFKTAVSGTPRPVGPYVVSIQHVSQVYDETPMTNVVQWPVSQSSHIIAWTGGDAGLITNIQSSPSLTWSHVPGGANTNSGFQDATDWWWSTNDMSPSTSLIITNRYINSGVIFNDITLLLYDVQGLGAYIGRASTNGTAANTSNLTAPTDLNASLWGVVFMEGQWDGNTATNLVGRASGQFFDSNWYDGQGLNGPSSIDQNGGWGHQYIGLTNGGIIDATWMPISSAVVNNWDNYAGDAIEFASTSIILHGDYQGVFFDTNIPAFQSSGLFQATISRANRISGYLRFAASRYNFSGRLSDTGMFSNSIPRRNNGSLSLVLYANTSGIITGQVADGTNWTAQLTAAPRIYSAANPAPQNGKYTIWFPPGLDASTSPGGIGIASLHVDRLGNALLSGFLGDGTPISQRGFISAEGKLPFFVSVYSGTGCAFGWLAIRNEIVTDIGGEVIWFKLPKRFSKLYANGFTLTMEAQGSLYSFTNGMPLLNSSTGQVVLANGNLAQPLLVSAALNGSQILGAKKLALRIFTSSGLFGGHLVNSNRTIVVHGAVFQKQNIGYGLFLGTNQSGSVSYNPE